MERPCTPLVVGLLNKNKKKNERIVEGAIFLNHRSTYIIRIPREAGGDDRGRTTRIGFLIEIRQEYRFPAVHARACARLTNYVVLRTTS